MSKKTKKNLNNIIAEFKAFFRENHRLPSYSEIAKIFGYASKNAAFRLVQKLIDEGLLSKDEKGKLRPNLPHFSSPLVGYIQAGFPSPAEEELVDMLTLDDYLIEKPEATFLLKVIGDSMIDAGIHQGDLVIIEREAPIKNGDIVVANVDNEWTLKYYYKRNGQIELVPANDKYPVIKPENDLTLGGKVKAIVRKY